MQSTTCDVLVVGGGTGGCAAALALTALGLKVVMTEEFEWIGGQLTSQAVPPDEHPWIESFGCTRRYRTYRNLVRQFYRDHMPLSDAARSTEFFNPGMGWVSKLCHEPRIGWIVLNQMLQPSMSSRTLDLRIAYIAVRAEMNEDRVEAVVIRNTRTGIEERIQAEYVLDASELGDLLPMTRTEYVTGAESKADTAEPNAVEGGAEPDNVQGITWVMALGYDSGRKDPIAKPAQYEKWRSYKPDFWPDKLLSFAMIQVQTGNHVQFPLFGKDCADWFNLFQYRQIIDPAQFRPGAIAEPVSIANWPQNDYYEASIIDEPAEVVKDRLEQSRQLSLSFLYWLQTEAPRHDGGMGYPGLHLRPDVVGSEDGLAQAPYIRESRRMRARFTVLEQHVSTDCNPGRDRAPEFKDSVGVGSYRIDLHPSTNGKKTLDTGTLPFQIPLGSLIPIRTRNLLPACKNLGVTHITNGCYRLHPVEWNIGESAGLLAAFCIQNKLEPAQVWESESLIKEFQKLCADQGIEIAWPQLHSL
jgi:hypothetical protein